MRITMNADRGATAFPRYSREYRIARRAIMDAAFKPRPGELKECMFCHELVPTGEHPCAPAHLPDPRAASCGSATFLVAQAGFCLQPTREQEDRERDAMEYFEELARRA